MSRKRILFRMVSVLVLLSLVACSRTGPTATPSKPVETVEPSSTVAAKDTAVPPTPVPPTPTPGPKYGGTLHLAWGGAISELDPHDFIGGATILFYTVYNRLVRVGRDGSIVPDLAKSWEVSSDGLTYTFHLFEGVKFQNVEPVNGREMTADDVVWNLDRLLGLGEESALQPFYAGVDKGEAVDRYTVKIVLTAPWSGFLARLGGDHGLFIAPHEAVETWGNLNEHAVGTGPFILETYGRETGATVRRNPDYFVEGLPYLDGIRWTVIPDYAAKQAAFLAKEIDAYQPSMAQMKQWREQYPTMLFEEGIDRGLPVLVCNSRSGPLSDVRVRQAIDLAIDRKKLLDVYGVGDHIVGPIPPYAEQWALPQAELEEMPGRRYPKDEDIAEAKRLLAEAGYPDGKGLENVGILYNGQDVQQTELATIIQGRLEQDLGVTFEMRPADMSALLNALVTGDYDLCAIGTDPVADPDDALKWYDPSGYGALFFSISPETEPELIDLMTKQRAAADVEERQQLVWEAQRVILDRCYVIYLVNRRVYSAHWPSLHDVHGNSPGVGQFYDVIQQWLDR